MALLVAGNSVKMNLQPKVVGFDSANHVGTGVKGKTFLIL